MIDSRKLKISIITVCLNSAETIESTIKSVITQDYSNFEYIIIDGKSSDDTLGIIRRYKQKIAVMISEKDNGIYDAMNKAISLANGDFLFFLGADDQLCPNILTQIVPYLEKNRQAVHYGQILLSPSNKIFGGKFNKWRLIHRNIAHQSIFYPAQIFKIRKFDETYKIAADWEMNLFLKGQSTKFEYNGLIVAVYNTTGLSSQPDGVFYKNRREIIKKHFGFLETLYLDVFILIPINTLNFIITNYRRIKRNIKNE